MGLTHYPILGRLTGKVLAEYQKYFKNVTGAASLHISLKLPPQEIPKICETLLHLYESDHYRTTFPNIHNVAPVREPKLIEDLNSLLVAAIAEKDDGLFLTVPDILNYEEGIYCSFRGGGLILCKSLAICAPYGHSHRPASARASAFAARNRPPACFVCFANRRLPPPEIASRFRPPRKGEVQKVAAPFIRRP